MLNDALQKEGLREFFQVEVAELNDAVSGKGRGQSTDANISREYADLVSRDQAAIESKARSDCACSNEKAAARQPGLRFLPTRSHPSHDTEYDGERCGAHRSSLE